MMPYQPAPELEPGPMARKGVAPAWALYDCFIVGTGRPPSHRPESSPDEPFIGGSTFNDSARRSSQIGRRPVRTTASVAKRAVAETLPNAA